MFCRPLMICETSEAKGLTPGTLTQSPGSFAIAGTFTNTNRLISARGVTRVQCPEFGEHVFTYLVTASR